MNLSNVVGELSFAGLESALTLESFESVLQGILPIIGTAVLVGFLFYTVRYAIGLFRGI